MIFCGDEVPRRDRFPCRIAGQGPERFVRERALRGLHLVGEVARQVAAPINEQLQKLVTQVAREKGVEVASLRAVLVKLGAAFQKRIFQSV